MLALQKTEPKFGAQLGEVPEPKAGDGMLLVEVEAVGICGSDIHMYEWTQGYEWLTSALPVVMGHEFCGRVVSSPKDIAGPAEGARVVVMPSTGCMVCRNCAAGRFDACRQRTAIGLNTNGAFARFVRVPPSACFEIQEDLPAHIAALTEPVCVADRAVHFSDVELGDDVVVLGPGIIGLATAYLARRRGAGKVTVVGKNDPVRLDIARKLGIDRIIDLADGSNLADHIEERSVDRVFEATGFSGSISQGLGLLRDYGMLVAIGIHHDHAPIDTTAFVRRKLQMRGAHSAGRDSWERVIGLIPGATADLEPLVTHRIGLDEAIDGFELCRARDACKVVVEPGA